MWTLDTDLSHVIIQFDVLARLLHNPNHTVVLWTRLCSHADGEGLLLDQNLSQPLLELLLALHQLWKQRQQVLVSNTTRRSSCQQSFKIQLCLTYRTLRHFSHRHWTGFISYSHSWWFPKSLRSNSSLRSFRHYYCATHSQQLCSFKLDWDLKYAH